MTTDSTTDRSTGEVATWQVITGSARGAAHRASGLPNQDAVASQDGPGGVVVAIADGHGHVRHFRSAHGAALAVDVACRVASQAAAGLAADATEDEEAERAGQVAAVTATAQVRRCQRPVRWHVTRDRLPRHTRSRNSVYGDRHALACPPQEHTHVPAVHCHI